MMPQPFENHRAAMRAAYLSQSINLLVTVLMVPLLLRYLDVNDYVLWSIFTTFGGVTLQLESAIQTVSVREIAREYHGGNAQTIRAAIKKAQTAYTILSVGVLVLLLALGLLYLRIFTKGKLGHSGATEWVVFVAAYALNYYMGVNNSILLGMARVTRFNNATSFTRLLYFVGAYLLLKARFGILGICMSFGLSVVVNCSVILLAARDTLKRHYASEESRVRTDAEFAYSKSTNILQYTLYMLSAFSLYRGGLLVATTALPKDTVGAYALTLQASAMLSALAAVPVQVWLNKLVKAIASGSRQEVLSELAFTMVTGNAIFICGAATFVALGNVLLGIIGSKVILPSRAILLLVCLAFLVELNILLMATFLVARHNYRFVPLYVINSLISICVVLLSLLATRPSIGTLVAIPLAIQSLVTLPLIFRMTCFVFEIAPSEFVSHLCVSPLRSLMRPHKRV